MTQSAIMNYVNVLKNVIKAEIKETKADSSLK